MFFLIMLGCTLNTPSQDNSLSTNERWCGSKYTQNQHALGSS